MNAVEEMVKDIFRQHPGLVNGIESVDCSDVVECLFLVAQQMIEDGSLDKNEFNHEVSEDSK